PPKHRGRSLGTGEPMRGEACRPRPRGRIERIAALVGTFSSEPDSSPRRRRFIQMKRLSATSAALTAAVLAASVALPAAASTGAPNGGTSATPPPADSSSSQSAQTASYKTVKATWYGPGLFGNSLA